MHNLIWEITSIGYDLLDKEIKEVRRSLKLAQPNLHHEQFLVALLELDIIQDELRYLLFKEWAQHHMSLPGFMINSSCDLLKHCRPKRQAYIKFT